MGVVNDYNAIATLHRSITEKILERAYAFDPYDPPLRAFYGEIRVVFRNDSPADRTRGALISRGVRAVEKTREFDRCQLFPYAFRAGKKVGMRGATFFHDPLKECDFIFMPDNRGHWKDSSETPQIIPA